MNLREATRLVLSESLLPLSAGDAWAEIVRRGLDKQSGSKGKTPGRTVSSYLSTAAKKAGSGIVAEGSKPARYRFVPGASGKKAEKPVKSRVPKSESQSKPKAQNSKFVAPCEEILSARPGVPMGVADILKSVLEVHPELPWKNANGAVRAALLRAAKLGGPIRQVHGSVPPLFFVGKADSAETSSKAPSAPTATGRSVKQSRPFSFLECAEKVLREFGAKQPMHYRDIAAKAIEQGWLVSSGETPETTMNAVIGTDIRKRRSERKPQIFVQHGKGFIGLAEWMSHGIRFQVSEHNKSVMAKMLKRLHSISPTAFERLIQALLEAMDFVETTVTPASGDGGIDVRGTWRVAEGIEIRMAIQAKRWKSNVLAPVVQAVRGSLTGSERGMIITTSDFSKGAREEAADPRKASTISLVNGEQLVKLLVKNGIGVKSDSITILELDPESELFPAPVPETK
jgi:restriction system protein